ncbi:MAG: nucleotidyltransferase family protein [Endozoicomonas sp.]
MPHEPGILLLAAGQSRRFRSHKLMHLMSDGRPMVLHSLDIYRSLGLPLSVVVKQEDVEFHDLLRKERVSFQVNSEAASGIGASIACGVRMNPDWNGWLIALADMPFIRSKTVEQIVAKIEPEKIIRPVYQGKVGQPVGFGRNFQTPLMALQGDTGGRSVVERNPERLQLLSVNDPGILYDIDTRQDLGCYL